MEGCRDGSPSVRFSHLHRGTLTIRFLVNSLTKALLTRLLSLARAANSRKSLGGSKLLPFKNDGGHCVLGDLQCYRNILLPFSRSVTRHNPVSELYAQFLLPHVLVFALTLSTVGPYIDTCVPFQIMSNQFNLPQVDSNQVVETSQG